MYISHVNTYKIYMAVYDYSDRFYHLMLLTVQIIACLNVEEEGSNFLRNVGKFLPSNMSSHLRRPSSSAIFNISSMGWYYPTTIYFTTG